eukprot:COSAG02_NODE_3963_length_5980_cov_16.337528_2_plen_172_part_00
MAPFWAKTRGLQAVWPIQRVVRGVEREAGVVHSRQIDWECSQRAGMATGPPEGEPGLDGEDALAELEKTYSVQMNGIEGGKLAVPVTTALLGVDLQKVIDSQVRGRGGAVGDLVPSLDFCLLSVSSMALSGFLSPSVSSLLPSVCACVRACVRTCVCVCVCVYAPSSVSVP